MHTSELKAGQAFRSGTVNSRRSVERRFEWQPENKQNMEQKYKHVVASTVELRSAVGWGNRWAIHRHLAARRPPLPYGGQYCAATHCTPHPTVRTQLGMAVQLPWMANYAAMHRSYQRKVILFFKREREESEMAML